MDTLDAKFVYRGGPTRRGHPDASAHLLQGLLVTEFGRSSRTTAIVASLVGYSAVQTRRLCVQEFGESLGSFMIRMRLERAAGRLAVERIQIRDIVREAGYNSSQAFAKAFKVHFGCSPAKFRSFNSAQPYFLPGYLIATGKTHLLKTSTRIRIGPETYSTFLYDGPIFLGRLFANGSIDWRLP